MIAALGAAAKGLGLAASIGGGLLKKKPKVPTIRPIDVTKEQKESLAGNIANYGLIEQLANLASGTALEHGLGTLDAILGKGTREQITATIASGLRGELSPDVVNQLQRYAAERGYSSGTAGSQYQTFGELRNYGLTSMGVQQQALQSANAWLAQAGSRIPTIDFTKFFQTTQDQLQQANINQQLQLGLDWTKNQLSAAYAPRTIVGEGLMNFGADLSGMGSQLLGVAAGQGIMGGGGAAGAYPGPMNVGGIF